MSAKGQKINRYTHLELEVIHRALLHWAPTQLTTKTGRLVIERAIAKTKLRMENTI